MNIRPTASLWSAILGACSIYGNASLGELAARNLFDMEPEKSVNYVVLSNIYTAAGAWDNAWKTRKLMEERSLRKNPGYSFLQSSKKKILLLEPCWKATVLISCSSLHLGVELEFNWRTSSFDLARDGRNEFCNCIILTSLWLINVLLVHIFVLSSFPRLKYIPLL